MQKLEIQGDVALEPTEKIELKNAICVKDKILAHGEVTGHAHVVTGDAEVFEIGGKMFVVVGKDGAKLEHLNLIKKGKGEHKEIVLNSNQTYNVILQDEYNPYLKIRQRVED